MIEDLETDALFADGFESALIGVGRQFSNDVAIYDYERCIDVLLDQGLDLQEAHEHMSFNVIGSWVGPNTPVFLETKLYP